MGATIARTIVLALALINQILVSTGHPVIPVENEDVEMLVSTAFTVIMAIVNWWKNNSFTAAAKAGDALMHEIKLNGEAQER